MSERQCPNLVAEEAAGDVDFLTSDDDNLLAAQNLLGDDRGQSTKEMTLAINDDGRRRESGHCRKSVDWFGGQFAV